jgi:hypothetical protein
VTAFVSALAIQRARVLPRRHIAARLSQSRIRAPTMKSIILAAMLFVGVSSACSSVSVSSDYDRSANFAGFKTWSWFAESGAPGSDASGVVSLTSARIKSALANELETRGYPEVARDGSFLVTFHTVVQQKIDAGSEPYGYAWRGGYAGHSAGPDIVTYDEGTLLVDFIDPKSKSMIWRGTATAVVDPHSSAESREGLIKEAVKKIVDEFPPKK